MEKFTYKKMFENEMTFWWFVARRKIISNAMMKLNISKGDVLELGSGTGGNVKFLKAFGNYTGIEKEQVAIDYSQSKHPQTNFIQGNLPQKLNEIRSKFDIVVLLDVLEHIEDDALTLDLAAKLLKKHGSIVMTMPAFPSLWTYHDDIHHHFRRYTKKELYLVCKKAGLLVNYHSYFNFLLFPVIVVIRFLKKILKIKSSDDKPISPTSNKLLTHVFGLESKLIPKIRLPFGLSHIIILKKMTEN